MIQIEITSAEREQKFLTPEQLQTAVKAIREDGFVVLKDAVDPEHVRILRDRMWADVDRFVNRPDAPFNWNRGNVQQDPPPFPPYLFRDVLANDFAIQVTREILGNGMYNAFYSGNTAMPSDQRQPVHADMGQLWPNQEVAHPPYALVVNLPAVDMGPENGSTEIWPGTHKDTSVVLQDGDIKVAPEVLEKQRAICPPIQPEVSAGSLLIRDMRLWHAGMPNKTQTPRPMIAMIHFVAWWPSAPIKLHRDAEELLRHPDLRQHAEYTVDAIDYVNAQSAHEFAESK